MGFLARTTWPPAEACDGAVLVVVEPWLTTPLPWYMLAIASGLAGRGRRVRVVWDDTEEGGDATATRQYQQRSIRHVLAALPASVARVPVSEVPPAGAVAMSDQSFERLAELNTVQKFRGEQLPPESDAYRRSVERALRRTAAHVEPLLEQTRPAYVVLGGGIYGSSGLFIESGRRLGCRVATLDSGPGVMLAATDGIAAHLDDIAPAFHALAADDTWVVGEAEAELGRRMQRKDVFQYQVTASTGPASPCGVLLPLNQSCDSAALGRHRVFKNQTEWMLETVAWVLNRTSETIVVRRHPIEQLEHYASNDGYEALLSARFGAHPRLTYISERMPVNTYDLIQQARVVTPYVSTVGIEAAALGRPVVTQGASCYADLGFVWSAGTREEYFGWIRRGLAGQLTVTASQREAAWRCYYLTQCCNFVHTPFTPQPIDFDRWVKESPAAIFASDPVVDLLDAIDTATPLSLVRHARRNAQRAATKLPHDTFKGVA